MGNRLARYTKLCGESLLAVSFVRVSADIVLSALDLSAGKTHLDLRCASDEARWGICPSNWTFPLQGLLDDCLSASLPSTSPSRSRTHRPPSIKLWFGPTLLILDTLSSLLNLADLMLFNFDVSAPRDHRRVVTSSRASVSVAHAASPQCVHYLERESTERTVSHLHHTGHVYRSTGEADDDSRWARKSRRRVVRTRGAKLEGEATHPSASMQHAGRRDCGEQKKAFDDASK